MKQLRTAVPFALPAAVLLALLAAAPRSARAESRDFGLGVVVGEPTGATAEIVFGPTTSLDLALGVELFHDNDLYFRLDFLFRFLHFTEGSIGIPIYAGIGGFVWNHDHGRADDDDDIHVGPRVPLGVALEFSSVPIQFFLEVALRLIFFDHGGDDGVDADLSGALGFRYYF